MVVSYGSYLGYSLPKIKFYTFEITKAFLFHERTRLDLFVSIFSLFFHEIFSCLTLRIELHENFKR